MHRFYVIDEPKAEDSHKEIIIIKRKLTLVSIDRIGFKEIATDFKPMRNGKIWYFE